MFLDKFTPRHFKALLLKTGAGKYQVPIIDALSHHLVVLTDGEHQVHEGLAYTASFAITTAATNGHRSGIYLKTPVTPQIHMIFLGSASTAANVLIAEAPTIASNTGSHGVAIFNRNRDSTNTTTVSDNATSPALNKITSLSEAQISGDGTWVTGTVLRDEPLSIGAGPKPAGGTSRDDAEMILKANTAYVLLITNTTASANDHLIQFDWYEHMALEA